MGKDVTSTCRTGTHLIFKSNPAVIFKSIPAVVNVGRILLDSATLTLATLAVLVLIGLWERHAQEATALGFSGIYERYLAFEAGFPNDPPAYREIAYECSNCGYISSVLLQTTPRQDS
jgi:hypothetical protein